MERDYKKEYREYHGKPEHIKERAERNKARKEMGLKKGDPREVDHIKPLSKGGGNNEENLRVVSRKTNREKGNKMDEMFDKAFGLRKKGEKNELYEYVSKAHEMLYPHDYRTYVNAVMRKKHYGRNKKYKKR